MNTTHSTYHTVLGLSLSRHRAEGLPPGSATGLAVSLFPHLLNGDRSPYLHRRLRG